MCANTDLIIHSLPRYFIRPVPLIFHAIKNVSHTVRSGCIKDTTERCLMPILNAPQQEREA